MQDLRDTQKQHELMMKNLTQTTKLNGLLDRLDRQRVELKTLRRELKTVSAEDKPEHEELMAEQMRGIANIKSKAIALASQAGVDITDRLEDF